MKYLTTALIAGMLALSPVAASAGLFDSINTSGWPTIGTKNFKLEAYGYDLRAYEWVSPTDPSQVCVAVFTGSGSGPVGMQCWEKGKDSEK